jgi:hypothetical protein
MRKLILVGMLILLTFVFITPLVQAEDSPGVLIEPDTILPDGYVDIYVTAATNNTILASFDPIKVSRVESYWNRTVLEDYYLANASGLWFPIILPDAGDRVRIRFPDAEVQVMDDVGTRGTPQIGTGPYGWWTASGDPRWPGRFAPPDLLSLGIYCVSISGSEGVSERLFLTVSSFFVIPEVPLGVVAALTACFAGLGVRQLPRKRKETL